MTTRIVTTDDFGHGGSAPAGPGLSRAQARPLDQLAHFIQKLEELSSLNGADISPALDDLPLPLAHEQDASGVSVREAVALSTYIMHDVRWDVIYYTVHDISTYYTCHAHRQDLFRLQMQITVSCSLQASTF